MSILKIKHLPHGKKYVGFLSDIKVQEALYFFHSPSYFGSTCLEKHHVCTLLSNLPAPVRAHTSCDLIEAGSHVQPYPGVTPEWPGIIRCLDPHGYERIRKRVLGGLPSPGHSTNTRLKHTLSLPVKGSFPCPGSFHLRGRLQVDNIARGYRTSKGTEAREYIFAFLLDLTTD